MWFQGIRTSNRHLHDSYEKRLQLGPIKQIELADQRMDIIICMHVWIHAKTNRS